MRQSATYWSSTSRYTSGSRPSGDRRRAGQIAEQHRHLLALALDARREARIFSAIPSGMLLAKRWRGESPAACSTPSAAISKPQSGQKRKPARPRPAARTGKRRTGPAGMAELLAGQQLGTAARTAHVRHSSGTGASQAPLTRAWQRRRRGRRARQWRGGEVPPSTLLCPFRVRRRAVISEEEIAPDAGTRTKREQLLRRRRNAMAKDEARSGPG